MSRVSLPNPASLVGRPDFGGSPLDTVVMPHNDRDDALEKEEATFARHDHKRAEPPKRPAQPTAITKPVVFGALGIAMVLLALM